jgi:hypothetical protein
MEELTKFLAEVAEEQKKYEEKCSAASAFDLAERVPTLSRLVVALLAMVAHEEECGSNVPGVECDCVTMHDLRAALSGERV